MGTPPRQRSELLKAVILLGVGRLTSTGPMAVESREALFDVVHDHLCRRPREAPQPRLPGERVGRSPGDGRRRWRHVHPLGHVVHLVQAKRRERHADPRAPTQNQRRGLVRKMASDHVTYCGARPRRDFYLGSRDDLSSPYSIARCPPLQVLTHPRSATPAQHPNCDVRAMFSLRLACPQERPGESANLHTCTRQPPRPTHCPSFAPRTHKQQMHGASHPLLLVQR